MPKPIKAETVALEDVIEAGFLFAGLAITALTDQPLIVSHGWFVE